jgi:hypothetical protein
MTQIVRNLTDAEDGFLTHCHAEHNHQGLAIRILVPGEEVQRTVGEVPCRERIGGLLRYYYREAA